MYKIRNKKTGLFYSQLNANYWDLKNSSWNKTGKIWNRLMDIEKIIARLRNSTRTEELEWFLEDLEIVEYEIVEKRIIETKDI